MRSIITIFVALTLLTGCATRVITARDFEVLRVIDGDTPVIHYDGEDLSVRLPRINTPEWNRPGASAATQAPR